MVPKFRGKRKDNGEWIVGVPVPNSFCSVVHMIPILLTDKVAYPPERLHEYLIEIDPETLGQSTGLKDKNGVEIFEGDVVEWLEHRGVVEFVLNNQQTMIIGASGYITDLDYSTDFNTEVIGNIHENPKILGQANES
ncbi:MAG: YopX family protein [Enterococcus casseliflavus]|nr:YopX family protein [Enterococcus casseliflavus]